MNNYELKNNKKRSSYLFVIVFMIVALVGLFGVGEKSQAQTAENIDCKIYKTVLAGGGDSTSVTARMLDEECTVGGAKVVPYCQESSQVVCAVEKVARAVGDPVPDPDADPKKEKTEYEKKIQALSCPGSMEGCLLSLFNIFLVTIPGLLLSLSGMFFNMMLAIGLSSKMISQSGFINSGWVVVRDISNIFFIIILLYASIQLILGMGGHDVKKIITRVIIVALLINFSMFFTKVVIDTSNVLAHIFYSRLHVDVAVGENDQIYIPATNLPEDKEDISGAFVDKFNPTKLLSKEFFEQLQNRTQVAPAGAVSSVAKGVLEVIKINPINRLHPGVIVAGFFVPGEVPTILILGVMLISGALMLFATYCFFMAGLSFLGRLIELWILIIFSPFAFMSFAVPFLENKEYIGWDDWLKRLLSVSFMAPIFMFFLYFIFLLLKTDIFKDVARANATEQGSLETILFLIIPALIILTLLLKATDFAKKGAGKFGEMAIGAGKALAGAAGLVAIGVATGGVAAAGRGASMVAAKASKDSFASAKIAHEGKLKAWRAGPKTTPRPELLDTLKEQRDKETGLLKFGAKINVAQLEAGNIKHARHEKDAAIEKAGLRVGSEKQFSALDEESVKLEFIKGKKSKIESDIRAGKDSKSGEEIETSLEKNGVKIVTAYGEKEFKTERRIGLSREVTNDKDAVSNGDVEIDAAGQAKVDAAGNRILSDIGKKKVEEKLNQEFDDILRDVAEKIGEKEYKHISEEAKEKIGMGTSILSNIPGGTYDLRNIAEALKNIDKRDGLSKKAVTGLVFSAAALVRLGLNKGTGIDTGTPKGNFLDDMKETFGNALKMIKVDVKLDGGGGGGGHGPAPKAHTSAEHDSHH